VAVLHRIIHKIAPDKWDEVVEWEEKYEAIESRYGAPPKRLYRPGVGPYDTDTLIVEEDRESLAALQEMAAKYTADPEWQKVDADSRSVFLSTRHELYNVLK
jgi:hypothetical protein